MGGARAVFLEGKDRSWRGPPQWPLCVPASTTSSALKRESFRPAAQSAAQRDVLCYEVDPQDLSLGRRTSNGSMDQPRWS